jgi:hypothetical protein
MWVTDPGRRVITASANSVAVWDADTGQAILTFRTWPEPDHGRRGVEF